MDERSRKEWTDWVDKNRLDLLPSVPLSGWFFNILIYSEQGQLLQSLMWCLEMPWGTFFSDSFMCIQFGDDIVAIH